MAEKRNLKEVEVAGEVFRQFAWHLAATLAKPQRRAAAPRPKTAPRR